MKKVLIFACFVFSSILVFSQNSFFTYQAVVRDNNNYLVANQNVGIRISLIRDIPNGVGDYIETHTVQTNPNGLLTLMVGKGNVVSGSLANVDWSNHTYYLKSEIDPTGGNNYTITGVQIVSAVPFAQYSLNSNYTETQVISISNDTIFLTGGTNSFVKLPAMNANISDSLSAYINDVGYITSDSIPANVSFFQNDAGYITSYVDSQQISLSGDTLKLERGGSVLLTSSCCAAVDSLKEMVDSLNNVVALLESIVCKPAVVTDIVTSISTTSAVCGGGVTSPCGIAVSARGVCWNTSGNANLTENHTSNGSGTGNFASNLSSLAPNTTYYVRAYLISGNDTIYGNERIFTTECDHFLKIDTISVTYCTGVGTYEWQGKTLTSSGIYYDSLTTLQSGCDSILVLYLTLSTTVTDYDGNVYNTLQIDNQCWMKENLRTTKYADGTAIPEGSVTSTSVGYFYHVNGDSVNDATYGLLYNWKAVMRNSASSSTNPSGVQGVCPKNWHIPSDAEWTQLTDYLSSQNQYICGSTSTFIAKSLASKTGWTTDSGTCTVGNTQANNNSTGFNALPAGTFHGNYNYFSTYADFWSSTQNSGNYTWYRSLHYKYAYVYRNDGIKYGGLSVRCLKD